MALLPGYKGLGGTAKQVQNLATGEILSRRQYAQQVKRGNLLTNEALAKLNKQTEPLKQLARPTKGRASLLKLPPTLAEKEAARRLKARIESEKAAELIKQEKITKRKIEAKKRKKVHVPKITARLLKPGHMGRRIPFNEYADYEELYDQAKRTRKIFAYGMGLEGVDVRSGAILTPTLWRMRGFDGVIEEDEFNDVVEDWLSNHLYFLLTNYWMHLAFSIEYAKEKSTKRKPKKKK